MNKSRMGERRHELITDLVELAERRLIENEIPPTVARIVANDLADGLVEHWGGQHITIPKEYRWRLDKLELDAYDLWTRGEGFDTLALRFDMTERGMRKRISRVRAKLAVFRNSRQMDMLDRQDD